MMSLSKLLRSPVIGDSIIIGTYRQDLEIDRDIARVVSRVLPSVEIVTSTEGRKLVPIRHISHLYDKICQLEGELARERRKTTEWVETEGQRIEKETREKAHTAGLDKGHQEGYRQGLDKGQTEARKVVASFDGLIRDAVRQRQQLLEEARQKILEMVIEIARKVTFEAARIDPDITAEIISNIIRKLTDKSKIKVKVNPDHLAAIEQQIERFKSDSTAIKDIAIEPDARVRSGGCYIETPTGDVDVRLETQMDIIAGTLTAGEDQ